MTQFGTKVCDLSNKSHTRYLSEQIASITELQRTVELDVVEYVDDSHANGTEIKVGDEQ